MAHILHSGTKNLATGFESKVLFFVNKTIFLGVSQLRLVHQSLGKIICKRIVVVCSNKFPVPEFVDPVFAAERRI